MGAPPGADGRDRPRLRPARDADAAPAGEAHDDRADVPLRPARRRAATASSGSSTSRRSATRVRRSTPRSSSSGTRFYRRPASRASRSSLNSIGDAACRPAYIAALAATTAATSTDLPPTERDRLERNAAPPARLEGPGDGRAQRRRARGSPTTCARRARRTSRASRRTSRRSACRSAVEPGPRPRARLLHAHGVRVLRRGPRGPAAGARRRRPLRRAGRAAGRQADAGDRVRAGPRPGARSCSRRQGRAGAADAACRSPSSSAPIRTDTIGAPRDRDRAARRRDPRPAPTSAGASSAGSSRRRRETGRTSR